MEKNDGKWENANDVSDMLKVEKNLLKPDTIWVTHRKVTPVLLSRQAKNIWTPYF
jgi:hypothetical protein